MSEKAAPARVKPLYLALLAFGIALAFKDVGLKACLVYGLTPQQTLIMVGFALLVGSAMATIATDPRRVLETPIRRLLQPVRLCVNIVAWCSMIISLDLLDASTVNVLNKATIPAIVLLGALVGTAYRSSEIILSVSLLSAILGYSIYIVTSLAAPIDGLGIFTISLSAVVIEYLFLAKVARDGSLLDMTLPPSVGMMIGGIAIAAIDESGLSLALSDEQAFFITLTAVALIMAYMTSKVRYRLLPAGIADVPTVFVYFIIVALEWMLFGRPVTVAETGVAGIVLVTYVVLLVSRTNAFSK